MLGGGEGEELLLSGKRRLRFLEAMLPSGAPCVIEFLISGHYHNRLNSGDIIDGKAQFLITC